MKIRVYYEDTDTGGVVYHSNYLNFCERARSEAFFERGMSPVLQGGHFVARRVEADYIGAAKLGDELHVKTRLDKMSGASFILEQIIYKDDKKIFEQKVTLAYVSFEGRPQRISDETKELINSLFA